ncbi:unnamed protein product [Leuciscus chuanchicus]
MFYGVRFSFSGEFLFTPSQLDNVQARVYAWKTYLRAASEKGRMKHGVLSPLPCFKDKPPLRDECAMGTVSPCMGTRAYRRASGMSTPCQSRILLVNISPLRCHAVALNGIAYGGKLDALLPSERGVCVAGLTLEERRRV